MTNKERRKRQLRTMWEELIGGLTFEELLDKLAELETDKEELSIALGKELMEDGDLVVVRKDKLADLVILCRDCRICPMNTECKKECRDSECPDRFYRYLTEQYFYGQDRPEEEK